MKKNIALLLTISLILTLFGCTANNTSEAPSTEAPSSDVTPEETESFKYLGHPVDWISDVPLSEIKSIKYRTTFDIQPNMFITKSGDLFLFSLDKLFSNEQTCKKVDTDMKFDRFYLYVDDRNHSTIVSSDGNFYRYDENDSQIKVHDLGENKNPTATEYSKNHINSYGEYQMGHIINYVYYYIEGNNLYKALYSLDPYPELNFVSETIIDTIPDGETFISLDGKVIKTDKAFYKVGVKNHDEVDKYEDVEPIEGLEKIEDASEQYDDIAYFNWSFIIYKNDNEHIYQYNYY